MKQPFNFVYNWLGSIPFEQSLETQDTLKLNLKSSLDRRSFSKENLSQKVKNSKGVKAAAEEFQFYFLGFEVIKPVITLGLRADESHVLFTDSQLKQNNISKLKLRRGGEATLHAPGQLVIYPVLSLPHLGLKVKDFIILLEEITQSVLKDFGIKTKKEGKYAGLYTDRGKICFFGIHISGGISQHGASINVDNDLNLFHAVKSCGEQNRSHDSLSLYPKFSLNIEELFIKWCEKAVDFFKAKIDKKKTIKDNKREIK